MPINARTDRERKRDRVRAIGEAMRRRISSSSMTAVDDRGRFTRGFLIPDGRWLACRDCNAPMVELPLPNRRYGYLPAWFCPLCDFHGFAEAVAQAVELAPLFEAVT